MVRRIIGDTEHDIACGRAIRARTVAVATGSRSREKLAESKPDFSSMTLARRAKLFRRLAVKIDDCTDNDIFHGLQPGHGLKN